MKGWLNGKFGRQARFIFVGAWNTLFGYGVFLAFNAIFSGAFKSRAAAYMSAIILSNIFSIVNAFIFHKHITFRSRSSGWAMILEFFRFSCTYLASFALSLILMPVLVEIFKLKPAFAAIAIILVTTIISYLAHANFSFKKGKDNE